MRVLDRVGKGIRGAPRDAMLAAWTTPATRGKVYGFHRGMDHPGAVVGPALASLFLFFYPGSVPDALRADDHPGRDRGRLDLPRPGTGCRADRRADVAQDVQSADIVET